MRRLRPPSRSSPACPADRRRPGLGGPGGCGGADPAGAAQRGDRRGRSDPADRRPRVIPRARSGERQGKPGIAGDRPTRTLTLMTTVEDTPVRGAVAARVVDLTKVYGSGDARVHALDGVTLDFAAGEFTAVMGPSGSGKSTLMHCWRRSTRADAGEVSSATSSSGRLKDKALTRLRRDQIGFVFQALQPGADADRAGEHPAAAVHRRAEARPGVVRHGDHAVGLGDRLSHRPNELSGGQQQRVAVARALVAGRRSCSPTSRPAISTPGPAPRCSRCCAQRRRCTGRPS